MDQSPHIVRIAQAIFTVTDLAASKYFYVDLLGLNVLHENHDSLYLRGTEDREWTLKLESGRVPRVRQIGYKVWSEAVLDELVALADAEGLPYRFEEEQDRPRILRLQDPFGFPVAFYYQSTKYKWLLQEYHLHRGAGVQRVDHVNVFSPQVGEMTAWYGEKLGFRTSEYAEDDHGNVWASWVQRRGSVHDLAMTNGLGPRMHHYAYWIPDGSRILQLCDIMGTGGHASAIERGPGRHGISNAFYLYLRDPDGHRIELYTSDYITVDPDFEPIRWSLNDPRRQQLWGGLAPRSWFYEGSAVEAFDGTIQAQHESPLQGLPTYIS